MLRAIGTLGVLAILGCAGGPGGERSAWERDPSGWIDLMPGKDLKGWRRVAPPPDRLAGKAVWSVDPAKGLLLCDGEGAKEMLLEEVERGDGIFHVEWRWRNLEGKTGHNGGVYVRTSLDGRVWHQAQVAAQPKPPVVGDLFAMTPVGGEIKRVDLLQEGPNRMRPLGEWNTYEISCRGKEIALWVNGALTVTWRDCAVPRGHLGLQAEFFFLEFRNLKFKPL